MIWAIEPFLVAIRMYPPFGRQVQRILNCPGLLQQYSGHNQDCSRGTVWIATGPGAWDWKYRHHRKLTVVMPFGADPNSYHWGFIVGHEPPLILPPIADFPEEREALAMAMVRDGLLSVLTMGHSGFMKFYREAA